MAVGNETYKVRTSKFVNIYKNGLVSENIRLHVEKVQNFKVLAEHVSRKQKCF
jgi:hypothetical protein